MAPVATPAPSIVVGYFSLEPKDQFEQKIKPNFDKLTKICGVCEISNLTPYDDKGQAALSEFAKVLKKLPENVKILFFDFNLKRNEISDEVVEILSRYASQGPLVVAASGVPRDGESSRPLSKTVFGQVKSAFVIGELGERDRLVSPQGFFGPEMLMAVRPPKEMRNQNLGPLLFTSKLASNYSRKTPEQWVSYAKQKKEKTRKIWLELDDIF